MSHTPGPWIIKFAGSDRFGTRIFVESETSSSICELVRDGRFREYANADLIAAAPDLLNAAKNMLSAMDLRFFHYGELDDVWLEHKREIEALRSAIAKAETAVDTVPKYPLKGALTCHTPLETGR